MATAVDNTPALDGTLRDWLQRHAPSLDQGAHDPDDVLPRLAAADLFRNGTPRHSGGDDAGTGSAIRAIGAVAEYSLTAAFVFWSQRTFIEYLLQSPNQTLRDRWLPALLNGECAGATGLSNAMKYLSGIEALQVQGRTDNGDWILDGQLPWVTNLRRQGFVVAAAVADTVGQQPLVVAIPHDAHGLQRSADLELMALQSSNTAAIKLHNTRLPAEWVLHRDAHQFLPRVRPAFLGLQCGLSIGLARSALLRSGELLGQARSVLRPEWLALRDELAQLETTLCEGVDSQRFVAQPRPLFQLRIRLAAIAGAAVQLELQASGGKAYLRSDNDCFARRWREAAFLPIVTPSLVQLQTELQRQPVAEAAV